MPFYLVTHTSLVEAADENEAARSVLDAVRHHPVVRFEVRFDSETVSQVDVSGSQVSASLNDEAVETAKLEEPSPRHGHELCQHADNSSTRWHCWHQKVVLSAAAFAVTGVAFWTLLR